jgi:hypothetical protein
MIYLLCAVFFILGIVIGYKYCARVNGHLFQALYNGGVIIVKTEDGWQGTDVAKASMAMDKKR